jgi:hypothetical protein
MTVKYELTGHRFGFWTVQGLASSGKKTMWDCECVCGARRHVESNRLRAGRTSSCGCKRGELVSKAQFEHGARGTRLHCIWIGMRQRCNNPRNKAWAGYGGRGIKICPEWDDFTRFAADMGEPPLGASLDRRDNDAGYSKANCVWASPIQQANNCRSNRRITANGETMTLAQWSRRVGLDRGTITKRLARGATPEKALTPHPMGRGERA